MRNNDVIKVRVGFNWHAVATRRVNLRRTIICFFLISENKRHPPKINPSVIF